MQVGRIEERLDGFIREADRRFDDLEEELAGLRRTLLSFSLTIAASSVGLVFAILGATGHLS